MNVRLLAFARIREILGAAQSEHRAAANATVRDLYDVLVDEFPALADLRASTRFACNGKFVPDSQPLAEGDEVALLPPYGGG